MRLRAVSRKEPRTDGVCFLSVFGYAAVKFFLGRARQRTAEDTSVSVCVVFEFKDERVRQSQITSVGF